MRFARVITVLMFVLMFVLGLTLSQEQVLLLLLGGLVTTLATVGSLVGWPIEDSGSDEPVNERKTT